MNNRSTDRKIFLGSIGKPHGLKGHCFFRYFGNDPKILLSYKELFDSETLNTFHIEEIKEVKGRLIVKFLKINSRTKIEEFRDKKLYIFENQLAELGDDFYWYQLESLKVINKQEELLGVVKEIIETGSNDVLVVEPTQQSIDKIERLIPYNKEEIIISVSLENETIEVNWPKEY